MLVDSDGIAFICILEVEDAQWDKSGIELLNMVEEMIYLIHNIKDKLIMEKPS